MPLVVLLERLSALARGRRSARKRTSGVDRLSTALYARSIEYIESIGG